MKYVLIIFSTLILITTSITIIWSGRWNVANATLLILSLTLIALIFYAYETHVIASLTNARWERDNILNTTYSMTMANNRVLFVITNSSNLLVRAKVRCNLMVYGDIVESNEAFDGKTTWYIFPQQLNRRWFEIIPLLSQKGKSLESIMSETTEENRKKQLTMDLEIEFRDELANTRKLPKRRHFFDFKEGHWIPTISWHDDWQD